MSNDENTVDKSGGQALVDRLSDIPSILSSNRTILAVLAFLYLLPLGTAASTSSVRSLLFIITQIMIFGLLAMSFDLQLGRSALLNFGHVALFGMGSYFMAFSLIPTILDSVAASLPFPFNIIASIIFLIFDIPFPFSILMAMIVGGLLGLVMGLTTNRLRGTAFAFIALAIAEFIYNYFAQNPSISGGETGLTIPTPDLIRTGPFYLLFVAIAFAFLAAFVGMFILYLRKRVDSFGLLLASPVMIALSALVLIFGT
ncbi:hypothetical protein EU546_08365, partial [Candidatus Thorarchaeota archaeon]